MSMPSFPPIDTIPTREEVINLVLSSIAMEELSLSHVLNSEGEKIQYALGTLEGVSGPAEPASIDDLLKLNESVRLTMDSAMQNQMFLKAKMQSALGAATLQGPTGPTSPTIYAQHADKIIGTLMRYEFPSKLPARARCSR